MDADAKRRIRWLTDQVLFPIFRQLAGSLPPEQFDAPRLALLKRMLMMFQESMMRTGRVRDLGVDMDAEFQRQLERVTGADHPTRRISSEDLSRWENDLYSSNVIDPWFRDTVSFVGSRLMAGQLDFDGGPSHLVLRLVDRLNAYLETGTPLATSDDLEPAERVVEKIVLVVETATLLSGPLPARKATESDWANPDLSRCLVATTCSAAGFFARQFFEIEFAGAKQGLSGNLTTTFLARAALERLCRGELTDRHLRDAASFIHFASTHSAMTASTRSMEIPVGQNFPLVHQAQQLGELVRGWVIEHWKLQSWPESAPSPSPTAVPRMP